MGHRILIIATVIAVLPIASAANAPAQGRVVGRVIDQTGAVLPGVAIDLVVDKTEMTTTTDGNGHYLFEGVPAGTGELTFRLLDFGVLRRLVSVTHGKSVTSDNVLNLALNADVIVTGSGTFRNIADVENPAESRRHRFVSERRRRHRGAARRSPAEKTGRSARDRAGDGHQPA